MLFDPCGASKARLLARHGAVMAVLFATVSLSSVAEAQRLAPYLADRGTGIATSMFGEYVRKGELLVYPFYEFTLFNQFEYKPAELGFGLDQDFRGKFREHEANFFLAYGLSDRIALELESAVFTTARLLKDPSDPSALPTELKESGFGDTQAEIRYRFAHETLTRPELFSYLEVDFPFQRNRRIIGTHLGLQGRRWSNQGILVWDTHRTSCWRVRRGRQAGGVRRIRPQGRAVGLPVLRIHAIQSVRVQASRAWIWA